MKKKHKHIGLLFRRYIYQTHKGIVKYAKEAGWVLDSRIEEYKHLPANWKGDGIISHNLKSDSIIRLIRGKNLPTVDLGPPSKSSDLPRVFMDNKGIAEMAGEYLLSRGFENIGYIKRPKKIFPSISDKERYHALKNFVTGNRKKFFTLYGDSFIKQLKNIPKPLALMGENDWLTSEYLRQCYDAGYKIPYEIAFISVDNDPLYCDVAEVPLTSVDSDLEKRGYKAAELLDRLMNGEPPPEKPILISPKGVVVRESTNIMAVSHLPTARTLKFIWDNYKDKNLSVNKSVKISGMSRRRLEDSFSKYIGHSMPYEIQRLRLSEAKKLLKESDLKIYEIAEKSGFSSPEHMIRAFKKQFNLTPGAFRKKA